jgi:hypothetical protein
VRPVLRALGAAFAAALALTFASIASGDASDARASAPRASAPSTQSTTERAPRKKPAHTKRKKTPRRTVHTRVAPSSRLAFAAPSSADATEVLVDESQLPPPTAGACPTEMASIEGRFCVDRWEASLVEETESGDRPFPYTEIAEGHVVRAVSAPGVMPQGYVSGADAGQACARSGKRLCSRMEWRKACAGPRSRLFGYANYRQRGRCNDSGRSPMLAIWGSELLNSRRDWDPLKMNDARLNAIPGSLAATGSHETCTNEYGVFDMVGNLHEWTSDPRGTFQGGYYLDTTINGDGCAYATTAHDFDYHDYSTGFRCCADPR